MQINDEQKVIINKINVTGNTITEEKVIRDNLLLSEGDYLNLSKVKKIYLNFAISSILLRYLILLVLIFH